MKKFARTVVSIKNFTGMIFVGLLVLLMLAKAIFYGVFEIKSLHIVALVIMAVIITALKLLGDLKIERFKINKIIILVTQGIFIVGVAYLFNYLFTLFEINGIEYLYFGLLVLFAYCAALFGFWLMSKAEVKHLNLALKEFKKD
jgi:hypothetical protein